MITIKKQEENMKKRFKYLHIYQYAPESIALIGKLDASIECRYIMQRYNSELLFNSDY